MAAYFTGGGGGAGTDVVQAGADGLQLQTLYLMNPSYVGYTDAAPAPVAAANMMLFNSAVSSLTPASFGNQPTTAAQHFVGIPLQAPPPSGYNLWGPDTTTTGGSGGGMSPARHQQQGTSAASPVLSLSFREAPPVTDGKYMPASSQEQVVMGSKYLKAAQELLDEAVSVSKGVEEAKRAMVVKKKEDSEGASGGGGAGDGDGSKNATAAEMSTAEWQELPMKKSKLVNMLDEVEQRYRQYHRQMQAVAVAFEAAAGPGSARTYTSLALRTISRQFRCLRDAIAAQVRSACRALGEDCDAAGGGGGGRTVGSRLRFIDHQIRQQRALQQLGMVGGGGGGAWRPQRGLPESAVSVLRSWLFEHFLHPYPKDSDKVMLAKQTGLTRSQVSNWFINARVRLWKPMVEEMYAEEAKVDKDPDVVAGSGGGGGGSSNTDGSVAEAPKPDSVVMSSPSAGATMSRAPRVAGSGGSSSSKAGVHTSLLEIAGDQQQAQASFYGSGGGGDSSFQHRLKKARTADEAAAFHVSDVTTLQAQAAAAAARQQHDEAVSHRELLMKFMEAGGSGGARGAHPDIDDDDVAMSGGYSLFTPAPYGQFVSEQFAFAGHGRGGVSLTLGLPRGAEQTPASFLAGSSNGSHDSAPVTTVSYDTNMQSTKSFGAAQLMGDFVA
ncbi:hypothetical protein ABZP36_033619 [Zizania latifolia]